VCFLFFLACVCGGWGREGRGGVGKVSSCEEMSLRDCEGCADVCGLGMERENSMISWRRIT